MTQIPADVAFQAKFPSSVGPGPHPDTKAERIMTDRFCLLITSMPTVNFVECPQLTPDQVGPTIEEVRDLLRARGRGQAAWWVDRAAGDVEAALRRHGMTDYEDPPLEPSYAAMAMTSAPLGAVPADVEVRRCIELADYLAAGRLACEVFDITGADRDGLMAAMERRHVMEHDGRIPMAQYLAFIDGEVVGEAQSSLLPAGTNLSGGSVVESARGRGVYRALVAARWEAAVQRGVPALTVQAGAMSQPVLSHLGFETVAVCSILRDQIG